VDIGAASLDELVLLPGIGPARAGDILALRSALGGFTSPDDLLGVPGIGPATFLRLEPWITLETRDDPR
jgi:competence protein ComEA